MEGLREVDEETWKHMTTPSALGADAMDDEKLIAALRLRVKANAEYDIYVGRKPLKGTLDEQAADRLLSLREENARLRPPCTPEGLHEYSSLGCIAFFKTEADCDAFMKWLSDRDDEARAALTPPAAEGMILQ